MINPGKMLVGYVSFAAAISITLLIGLWAMPHDYWFKYEVVKPILPAKLGQPLIFQSFRMVHRPSKLQGIDVLFCDLSNGAGFIYYSEKPWQGGISNPPENKNELPKPWRYGGKVPSIPSKCYLKTTVSIDVGYGIIKDQKPPLISETFQIE